MLKSRPVARLARVIVSSSRASCIGVNGTVAGSGLMVRAMDKRPAGIRAAPGAYAMSASGRATVPGPLCSPVATGTSPSRAHGPVLDDGGGRPVGTAVVHDPVGAPPHRFVGPRLTGAVTGTAARLRQQRQHRDDAVHPRRYRHVDQHRLHNTHALYGS